MFFHIDESGNTGNFVFDKNQPKLSYGLLSSTKNVDVLGGQIHKKMLKELGVESIHANHLGVDKLTRVSPLLYELQKKMKFDFDYYFIDKPSFALVLFFDAVFDAGLNEAVKWDYYWTPLRYLAIHKLSLLFDQELLEESWNLCTHRNINRQEDRIVKLLEALLERVNKSIPDKRSQELISDAFKYGIANPLKLDFGAPDQKLVSPNAVGFQFLGGAMARRLRKKKRKNAFSIIVDQQNEFNKAQEETFTTQRKMSEGLRKASEKDKNNYIRHPLYFDSDVHDVLKTGFPNREMRVSSSDQSIGLQIVDVYLWIINRKLNGKSLSGELKAIASTFLSRSMVDGISMEGMRNRWEQFEERLPKFEDLTEKHHEYVSKINEQHRNKVNGLNI